MLKSFIKALVVVAGLVWAGMACAVGLGNASISSALGQPLKVEIALTAVSESERVGLTARLASPDAFKTAGLDFPYHLAKLNFNIVTRGGETYIEVTSKDPVNDSFVNLLVELSWSSGHSFREYTFLLDPPDYKPELPKGEETSVIPPTVAVAPTPEVPEVKKLPATEEPASGPSETGELGAEGVSAPSASTAVPEEVVAAASGVPSAETGAPEAAAGEQPAQPEQAAVPQPAPEKPVAETIVVKRGDTLSKIAAQIKEPDVTVEQMLVALYRANVNKFDGKNMNRLRAGKILTVPDAATLEKISNKAAIREIHIQTANWNAYRARLAAAPTAAAPVQAPTEAGGPITPSVTEKTPPVKEPKEKLVLSHGEVPGAKAAGKETKDQAKDEAAAKEKAGKESAERAAKLEKNVKDMEKLMEMKGTPPAASAVTPPASAVAPASGARPAKPKMAPPAPAPAAETGILDDILGIFDSEMFKDPVYLGAGAGGLLLLIGLVVFLLRRRGNGGGGRKKKSLRS